MLLHIWENNDSNGHLPLTETIKTRNQYNNLLNVLEENKLLIQNSKSSKNEGEIKIFSDSKTNKNSNGTYCL